MTVNYLYYYFQSFIYGLLLNRQRFYKFGVLTLFNVFTFFVLGLVVFAILSMYLCNTLIYYFLFKKNI